MPITTEKKTVARCDLDGCKAVRYGTDDEPPVGFVATVERITDSSDGVVGHTVRVYACNQVHLAKAVAQKLADASQHETQTIYSDSRELTGIGAEGE